MIRSYCHWQFEDKEYEVHYELSSGEIMDYSLYPEPPFDLSREQEREIFELIYDDARWEEEDE